MIREVRLNSLGQVKKDVCATAWSLTVSLAMSYMLECIALNGTWVLQA